MTMDLNPVARRVPLAVVVPVLVLFALIVSCELSPRLETFLDLFERNRAKGLDRLRATAPREGPAVSESLWSTIIWFCAAPAAIVVLGFLPGSALYTAAWLRIRIGCGISRTLTLSLVLAGLMSALLGLAAGRPLVDGLISRWFLGL